MSNIPVGAECSIQEGEDPCANTPVHNVGVPVKGGVRQHFICEEHWPALGEAVTKAVEPVDGMEVKMADVPKHLQ